MKTREEINELIRQWKFDPFWNLEDTEGFEEHREELLRFRETKEAEWRETREREDQARYLAQYDRRLAEAAERQAAALERQATAAEERNEIERDKANTLEHICQNLDVLSDVFAMITDPDGHCLKVWLGAPSEKALERIAAVLEKVTNNDMLSVAFWEQV